MGIRRFTAYAAIYLLWGGAYLAVRVLVQKFPPFSVAGLRYSLAAVSLLPILLLRRVSVPSRQQMFNAAWTGLLLLAAGYGIVFWAEQRLPSWLAAVLVSTSLLWTYIGECLLLRTSRLRLSLLVPFLSGLCGLPLLVDADGQQAGVSHVAALGVLLSALCWAAGSLAMKRVSLPRSPIQTASIQLAAAGIALLAISASLGEWRRTPPLTEFFIGQPLIAMMYLVVGASTIGYVAFLWLIAHDSASRTTTFTYVNPIVAMVLGVLAAHERISTLQLVGAFAVLSSVVAVWRMQSPAGELDHVELHRAPEI